MFNLENYSNKLLGEVPIPLLIISKKAKKISYCNSELQSLSGYTQDEIIDSSLDKFLDINYDSFLKESTLSKGKIHYKSDSLTLVSKDGKEIIVNVYLVPVNGDGKYLAAWIIDITDLEQIKIQLESRNKELELENSNIREYNLEMARLEATNTFNMETLKANNKLRLYSLLVIIIPIFTILIIMMLAPSVPESMTGGFYTLSGGLVGSFLAPMMGVTNKEGK